MLWLVIFVWGIQYEERAELMRFLRLDVKLHGDKSVTVNGKTGGTAEFDEKVYLREVPEEFQQELVFEVRKLLSRLRTAWASSCVNRGKMTQAEADAWLRGKEFK